jgi:hypothetical protein
MNDDDLGRLVDAWIIATEAGPNTPINASNHWAIDQVDRWQSENHEMLWKFILAIFKRDLPDIVIANLAAGPVEELLSRFGEDYIDRVESLARSDPKFNYVLGGVWQLFMTNDIWERVQAARRDVW